jgi:hypothetical protein
MTDSREERTMTDSPTVVLVHGAFADASGFAGVITELEAAGHTEHVDGSHTAFIAQPSVAASLIAKAAAG